MAKMTVPNPADTSGRRALKGLVKQAGKQLRMNQRRGDHLVLDEDMPAGEYQVEQGWSPEGWIEFTFTPGRVP